MKTLCILIIIAHAVVSILFVIALALYDPEEVVWKRKKFTADDARKISNDYSEDIDSTEDVIRQAAKQNETSVKWSIYNEKVVKHFENVGFVVTHVDKCIYNIDWSDDAKRKEY